MKRTIHWLMKAGIAAIVAFGMMTVFCYFYYNLPIHYTEASGATDYSWDKEAFCARGTEGFAYQYTDENGYVNTYPNKKDQVDILVMGSSHSEGFNVNWDENYTYVLNELFDQGGHDLYAYSIATSGHAMLRSLKNLENALERFKPQKYVVIETADLKFQLNDLEKLLNSEMQSMDSPNAGLIGLMQKSDVLRLLYYQMSQLSANKSPLKVQKENELEEVMDKILARAGKTAKDNGCRLIITYLSRVEYDYNGNLSEPKDLLDKEWFRNLCDKHGIVFLEMYPAYLQMYSSTNRLPRGFSNTAPGEGHTNKFGHACIAQELYKFITKEELP